jgi:Fe-S cluster biogenesis protein NfuA
MTDLDGASKRVEALLERFSALPATTGARADAEELVRVVSSLHGEALRRVARTLRDEIGDGANAVLERCCDDPIVAGLFITHGMHPVPLRERVERAIESVRPSLCEHGVDVEIVSVDEDEVQLRVQGTAEVIPAIERAILKFAPEVLEVRTAGETISLLEVR